MCLERRRVVEAGRDGLDVALRPRQHDHRDVVCRGEHDAACKLLNADSMFGWPPACAHAAASQLKFLSCRICRRAQLPERGWHTMRHTFGTHAALFGVNPWRLMTWLGHKRIEETMRYVHVADSHRRELPPELLAAAEGEFDPDRRILKLLGGRANLRQPDRTNEKSPRDSRGYNR